MPFKSEEERREYWKKYKQTRRGMDKMSNPDVSNPKNVQPDVQPEKEELIHGFSAEEWAAKPVTRKLALELYGPGLRHPLEDPYGVGYEPSKGSWCYPFTKRVSR